jgi:uncharacterized protein with ATP-grasp and redox domains
MQKKAEKETAKEIEEKAKAIIRLAKAFKSNYDKGNNLGTFPIMTFIEQVLEDEPYKDFSDKAKKKAKQLAKFL